MASPPKFTSENLDPRGEEWWQARLNGEEPVFHNDTPMYGFYAYQPSGKKIAPKTVAFWYTDDHTLKCKLDNSNVTAAYGLEVWPRCCKNPITYDVYLSVIAGNPWPSEVRIVNAAGQTDSTLAASPGQGHNSGNERDTIRGNIKEWEDRIRAAIKKGTPKTKVDADALADIATKLADLHKEGDTARKAVTDPLFKAYKDENSLWDFLTPVPTLVSNAKSLGHQFIREEQKRLQRIADEANAKIEAERLAEEAKNPRAAASLDTTPATRAPVVHVQPVTIGARKAVGADNRKVVAFDAGGGLAKAAAYFCSMEIVDKDIAEAVRKAAHKVLSTGVPVPGAKLESK